MIDPYRPLPEPLPDKSDWKVGDFVRVQYRSTTDTLLGELEGEHGKVMEVVDLDTDQCIRVRFPVETLERLTPQTRRRMTRVQRALRRIRPFWPPRFEDIGTEAWLFGGDLV